MTIDFFIQVLQMIRQSDEENGTDLISEILSGTDYGKTFLKNLFELHKGEPGEPGSYFQPLFDLMYNEHGLTLLHSEMSEIVVLVKKMIQQNE